MKSLALILGLLLTNVVHAAVSVVNSYSEQATITAATDYTLHYTTSNQPNTVLLFIVGQKTARYFPYRTPQTVPSENLVSLYSRIYNARAGVNTGVNIFMRSNPPQNAYLTFTAKISTGSAIFNFSVIELSGANIFNPAGNFLAAGGTGNDVFTYTSSGNSNNLILFASTIGGNTAPTVDPKLTFDLQGRPLFLGHMQGLTDTAIPFSTTNIPVESYSNNVAFWARVMFEVYPPEEIRPTYTMTQTVTPTITITSNKTATSTTTPTPVFTATVTPTVTPTPRGGAYGPGNLSQFDVAAPQSATVIINSIPRATKDIPILRGMPGRMIMVTGYHISTKSAATLNLHFGTGGVKFGLLGNYIGGCQLFNNSSISAQGMLPVIPISQGQGIFLDSNNATTGVEVQVSYIVY